MAKINNNSFVAWYLSVPDDDCYYALPLVQGDTIKCYANITPGLVNDNDDLGLWSEQSETVVYQNLGTVLELVADEGQQVYWEYEVTDLVPGVYRFVIDSSGPECYSNRFLVTANTDYTSVVKYRNSKNAFNTLYEEIPTFYNQLRIDLRTGNPKFNENVKGYETYQGNFINTKSDLQKLVEFNTRFFDANAHDGFAAMVAHSEFYIDEVRYTKPAQSQYQIEWSDFDDERIGNGSIDLLEYDYSTSIRNC